MENKLYISDLYDLYGDLLTDKQKLYFTEYYFNDLSLAEISENGNISRNAVHKQIKESSLKLEYYENVLKLYEKKQKIYDIIKKIENKKIKEEIEKII